jgi:hypothetical protein
MQVVLAQKTGLHEMMQDIRKRQLNPIFYLARACFILGLPETIKENDHDKTVPQSTTLASACKGSMPKWTKPGRILQAA